MHVHVLNCKNKNNKKPTKHLILIDCLHAICLIPTSFKGGKTPRVSFKKTNEQKLCKYRFSLGGRIVLTKLEKSTKNGNGMSQQFHR